MRCDGCIHWDKNDAAEEILDVRRCSKALELWEASYWDEDYNRVLKADIEDQKMFVMDGSSYRANLYTRPDFFCAHYTSK